MVIRIQNPKITEITQKIEELWHCAKCTLKQLQSLIGSLNFACRAITPDKPFCRRLINATCGLTKPHHHLRITADMKKDLKLWLQFLRTLTVFRFFMIGFGFPMRTFSSSQIVQGKIILALGLFCEKVVIWGLVPFMGRPRYHKGHYSARVFPLLVSLYIWLVGCFGA